MKVKSNYRKKLEIYCKNQTPRILIVGEMTDSELQSRINMILNSRSRKK